MIRTFPATYRLPSMKILFAVDLFETTETIRKVEDLARRLEAELLVDVTCQERPHYPFVIIELEIRHEAKRALSEWDNRRYRPCIILLGSPE